MSTPEGKVKKYLRERIHALDGHIRFLKWIGRRNAPDVIVFVPGMPPTFVETKAPGKRPRPRQEREIDLMRQYGAHVLVCPTVESIDEHFPLP